MSPRNDISGEAANILATLEQLAEVVLKSTEPLATDRPVFGSDVPLTNYRDEVDENGQTKSVMKPTVFYRTYDPIRHFNYLAAELLFRQRQVEVMRNDMWLWRLIQAKLESDDRGDWRYRWNVRGKISCEDSELMPMTSTMAEALNIIAAKSGQHLPIDGNEKLVSVFNTALEMETKKIRSKKSAVELRAKNEAKEIEQQAGRRAKDSMGDGRLKNTDISFLQIVDGRDGESSRPHRYLKVYLLSSGKLTMWRFDLHPGQVIYHEPKCVVADPETR